MPAVQLARLRIQTTRLAESFGDPAEFARGLDSLLELYGNRAFRPGTNTQPHSRLPAYNVPPLVMQQLEIELRRVGRSDPIHCLQNIDVLWASEILEMRQVSVFLLGEVPPPYLPETVAKLTRWCLPAEDPDLVRGLLVTGGAQIRRTEPDTWLALAADWLRNPDARAEVIGLWALEPFLSDTGMRNLPEVFRLLDPLVGDPAPAGIAELETILVQIYGISPKETQSFLRKNLEGDPSPQTLRLVRRLLPFLDADTQAVLRASFPRQERDPKAPR